jgi:hypothetical protein
MPLLPHTLPALMLSEGGAPPVGASGVVAPSIKTGAVNPQQKAGTDAA